MFAYQPFCFPQTDFNENSLDVILVSVVIQNFAWNVLPNIYRNTYNTYILHSYFCQNDMTFKNPL